MLHHVKKGERRRTGCHNKDRTELLRITLELERALATRFRKISESGRRATAGRHMSR
jgi:hypothetical protein